MGILRKLIKQRCSTDYEQLQFMNSTIYCTEQLSRKDLKLSNSTNTNKKFTADHIERLYYCLKRKSQIKVCKLFEKKKIRKF